MSAKHIDYIGFTFNGKHSSELGIVRTSEGSRFNENLLPTIQDKTVQVPGGDGMYHFGSYYTQRQFNISYAFDSLTEAQLNELKQWLGDKKIHTLILDEAPYKAYQAKVTGSASIKHIPFAEGATNRIYKGEGSIQFTAYDPYGYCKEKYLNNEYYQKFNNRNEWQGAANLLNSQGSYDSCDEGENEIKLYNPGVKETDFILSLRFNNGKIPGGYVQIQVNETTKEQFELSEISCIGQDDEIRINSKLNLIEGYHEGVKSGNIYNRFMRGSFFKIPAEENLQMIIPSGAKFKNIDYKYIYF